MNPLTLTATDAPPVAVLEKRIRILESKLRRSEENRVLLEEALESHILALKTSNEELLRSRETLRESEERYRNLALYDPLTQLPNRVLLYERLRHSILRAARSKLLVAVLFIDLDRFKDVNDKFGHATGDLVLKATGDRLSASIRGIDTAARLAGDEFVVLLESLQRSLEIECVVRRILVTLAAPLVIDAHQFALRASVGVSRFPDDGDTPETLLQKADAAMYFCKRQGGAGANW